MFRMIAEIKRKDARDRFLLAQEIAYITTWNWINTSFHLSLSLSVAQPSPHVTSQQARITVAKSVDRSLFSKILAKPNEYEAVHNYTLKALPPGAVRGQMSAAIFRSVFLFLVVLCSMGNDRCTNM